MPCWLGVVLAGAASRLPPKRKGSLSLAQEGRLSVSSALWYVQQYNVSYTEVCITESNRLYCVHMLSKLQYY